MNEKKPGVYTQETPGAQMITGVNTSTAGFTGIPDAFCTDESDYNKPVLITSWQAYQQQFGGLYFSRFLAQAVYQFFQLGGTICYVVTIPENGGAYATARWKNAMTINAVSKGVWGNILTVNIKPYPPGGKDINSFTLSVQYVSASKLQKQAPVDPGQSPDLEGLLQDYIVDNALQPVTNDNNQWVYTLETYTNTGISGLKDTVRKINENSLFIRVTAGDSWQNVALPDDGNLALAGGKDPEWVFFNTDPTEGIGALGSLSSNEVNITLAPDLVLKSPADQLSVQNEILLFNEQQQNLFFIADPPLGLSVTDINNYKSGVISGKSYNALNSSYGALYYPWFTIYDPGSQMQLLVPPSGGVAGVYAATDQQVGVWKSPAGVNDGHLSTAVFLNQKITDADQDILNPNGIDAIRDLVNYGITVWGARTLSSDPQWQYIQVRRLLIYIEQSLKSGLAWTVFEPSDPKLWSAVNRDITTFLTQIWQEGALFGSTAAEAFFVTVDASNNPPEVQQEGILYVDVGVAPVRPAEFIVIRLEQVVAGQN